VSDYTKWSISYDVDGRFYELADVFTEFPTPRPKLSIWEKLLDYTFPISVAALMLSLVANCISIFVLWGAL